MHELDHNNLVGLVEPLRGRGTWGNKFRQRVVQGRAGCPTSMGTGVSRGVDKWCDATLDKVARPSLY